MKTLYLPLEMLIDYGESSNNFGVYKARLKLKGKNTIAFGGTAQTANPFHEHSYGASYDRMKKLLGPRDLTPFIKQRLREVTRELTWKVFDPSPPPNRSSSTHDLNY